MRLVLTLTELQSSYLFSRLQEGSEICNDNFEPLDVSADGKRYTYLVRSQEGALDACGMYIEILHDNITHSSAYWEEDDVKAWRKDMRVWRAIRKKILALQKNL